MSFDEIKAAASALSPEDQQRLAGYLDCLAVMRNPEWREAVQASTARHGERLHSAVAEASRVAEDAPPA